MRAGLGFVSFVKAELHSHAAKPFATLSRLMDSHRTLTWPLGAGVWVSFRYRRTGVESKEGKEEAIIVKIGNLKYMVQNIHFYLERARSSGRWVV